MLETGGAINFTSELFVDSSSWDITECRPYRAQSCSLLLKELKAMDRRTDFDRSRTHVCVCEIFIMTGKGSYLCYAT
jgi:hypothetical protein